MSLEAKKEKKNVKWLRVSVELTERLSTNDDGRLTFSNASFSSQTDVHQSY